MWWGGVAQNGWGVAVLQQTGTLFAVWYTYGPTGAPTWYVMPGGGAWTARNYTAPLYSTKGSAWLGVTYSPAQFVVTPVGSMSLNFTDADNGMLSYTVNGVTQTKSIIPQTF